ncbi:hypothetical protein TcarDRAFT_0609 [Thermosinus carboxydivorans Nor1]|uniref:Uncharacterized protein n=1 Tax=Thermosinus carboxydivorans Nor1 TaxID=401526 RepID=A1HSE1_9FIRM|nr:hypothetical protein [Thermosinus carboxydivorans]EAX47101.1 hypothetical protein TcarDRAFT_0609 [Thermosinus carboxydivorans Nor1]
MHHSKPYLQAALLCEGVTTDENGRHNIHNEFSQYTMGYSQPFTVLTIWRGSENNQQSYTEKTEIIAPDGRVVASGENGPFSLKDSTYRQINSLLLENVDFTHEGIYELRVTLVDSQDREISQNVYPITVV